MKEIEEQEFNQEVLKSNLPVFVCFTAGWCHSCYPACLIAGELDRLYKNSIKFVRINIEKSPGLTTRFHISAVPTVLIFSNSQLLERHIGFQERGLLKRLLDNNTLSMNGRSINNLIKE